MAAVMEEQVERWTSEEHCRLDSHQGYEIIKRGLVIAPGSDAWHTHRLIELDLRIATFAKLISLALPGLDLNLSEILL